MDWYSRRFATRSSRHVSFLKSPWGSNEPDNPKLRWITIIVADDLNKEAEEGCSKKSLQGILKAVHNSS